MPNLSSLLEDSARQYPDREAVVLGDTRLTYAQVNGAANQVANLLVSRGIQPGDKVALSCPNLPYFPIVYYGILKAGRDRRAAQRAAQGPRGRLPPRRLGREGLLLLPGHRRSCRSAQAGHEGFEADRGLRALLHDHRRPGRRLADRGHRDAGPGDGRPAADVRHRRRPTTTTPPSSSTPRGTTGQPKGAELRHRNMHSNALAGKDCSAPTPTAPTPTCACCRCSTPSARPCIMNGGFAYGGTVVMLPRFEADAALKTMAKEERHLLRRRPDDVLGAARRPRRLRGRRPGARRQPAGRRRRRLGAARSRCTRSSRSGSASPSSRATACPRPRRSPASRRTARRSGSARSASRSRASR